MFIEVESGVKLYVEDLRPQDDGNGHTLMFLHGWPGNHRVFDYAYQILPHHRFRCIGLDFRGFGKSDKLGMVINTIEWQKTCPSSLIRWT